MYTANVVWMTNKSLGWRPLRFWSCLLTQQTKPILINTISNYPVSFCKSKKFISLISTLKIFRLNITCVTWYFKRVLAKNCTVLHCVYEVIICCVLTVRRFEDPQSRATNTNSKVYIQAGLFSQTELPVRKHMLIFCPSLYHILHYPYVGDNFPPTINTSRS